MELFLTRIIIVFFRTHTFTLSLSLCLPFLSFSIFFFVLFTYELINLKKLLALTFLFYYHRLVSFLIALNRPRTFSANDMYAWTCVEQRKKKRKNEKYIINMDAMFPHIKITGKRMI